VLNRVPFIAVSLLAALAAVSLTLAAPQENAAADLHFEITLAKGLTPDVPDGRLLLVLSRDPDVEPRSAIGETGLKAPPLLGVDVKGLTAHSKIVIDRKAAIFPLANLAKLPSGDYRVQAVFHSNRDLNLPDAPGNLFSDPVSVKLDPARGGVKLELAHKIPEEQPPLETDYVKYVKIKSELLSKFHGRPMFLRAGVILPRDFDKDKDRVYPLFVRSGGYGTRYTHVDAQMAKETPFRKLWLADQTPRMLFLHLDGAGPYGDPYQVNSANNGPYGDAITQELIPFVEKKYRGIGQSYARVVEGHSTGGWVSLALQIYYADFFNGCWSHAPDPVDFRAYELIDIYSDDNAYVNRLGFERPANRTVDGDTRYDVRHECLLEVVLGRGDRWELSGKDWCAWNAAFGPRGADGLPKPLWDGKTGQIDRTVLEHWQQYDLRRVLQKHWPVLGPRLKGKLHIWVGEADDYFLNNAVHLLDDFLTEAKPAYDGTITYGPRKDHSWRGLTDKQIMEDMAAAIEKGRKERGGAPKP
jgi:S-formylglutathione hydrolase FrmB